MITTALLAALRHARDNAAGYKLDPEDVCAVLRAVDRESIDVLPTAPKPTTTSMVRTEIKIPCQEPGCMESGTVHEGPCDLVF